MGAAKTRGSYEKRKAEAIEAGRVKADPKVVPTLPGPQLFKIIGQMFGVKK